MPALDSCVSTAPTKTVQRSTTQTPITPQVIAMVRVPYTSLRHTYARRTEANKPTSIRSNPHATTIAAPVGRSRR